MHPFRSLPVLFRDCEFVLYVNAFNDEHAVLRLFDFPTNFAGQLAVRLDFARLQRAPEGSKQSTRDRCNQIIDGRGVGLSKVLCLHSIVLRNRSMHAEDYRLGFPGKLCMADWSPFSFNMRLRNIRNFSHSSPRGQRN
jgi:hypothetical protein